jgi:hypothetical protein
MLLGGMFKTNHVGGRCALWADAQTLRRAFDLDYNHHCECRVPYMRRHMAALYKPVHQHQSTMILCFFS